MVRHLRATRNYWQNRMVFVLSAKGQREQRANVWHKIIATQQVSLEAFFARIAIKP